MIIYEYLVHLEIHHYSQRLGVSPAMARVDESEDEVFILVMMLLMSIMMIMMMIMVTVYNDDYDDDESYYNFYYNLSRLP